MFVRSIGDYILKAEIGTNLGQICLAAPLWNVRKNGKHRLAKGALLLAGSKFAKGDVAKRAYDRVCVAGCPFLSINGTQCRNNSMNIIT